MSSWEGRTVLVTGGSAGIGFAIASACAAAGASVWLVARDPQKLAVAAQKLGPPERPARTSAADLSALADLARVRDQVGAVWDELDVLVNNAGMASFRPLQQITPEDYERLFAVNVRAAYFLTQAFLPLLEKAKGSVINVSSHFAGRMNPLYASSAYSMTKAAVNAMTQALAVELGPRGIRVNGLAPGLVDTERVEARLADRSPQHQQEVAYYERFVPLGRHGRPEDLASLVLFLASDQAQWITGTVIPVDGGLTAN